MAHNVTEMQAEELEHHLQAAREFLNDRHATRERAEELNPIFPAWVLANATQMARLHEMGFTREDYHALRRKIAHDQAKPWRK